MPDSPTITFPTENYPIKVIADYQGKATLSTIIECMELHFKQDFVETVQTRSSENDKFISCTFMVHAQSEQQLSKAHTALMKIDSVRMVL